VGLGTLKNYMPIYQPKIVCSQQTKHGTAKPFHFLYMGPMSDVTMLRRLCVTDFGHAMCLSGPLAKSLADFSQSQANSKIVCSQHTKHGNAEPISFPPYGSNE
jgi:hypothetical protein